MLHLFALTARLSTTLLDITMCQYTVKFATAALDTSIREAYVNVRSVKLYELRSQADRQVFSSVVVIIILHGNIQ